MAESIIESRKYYKRNKILNIIRCNDNVSRYEIKKMTSYSMSTVLDLIEELTREGLIYEEQCEESRVGRRPVWLHLNPHGGYFIGVEFNGRKMHSAVLDFCGKILYETESPLSFDETKEEILAKIRDHIDRALAQAEGGRKKVFGIGIGVPGYVDKKHGIAVSYAHLKEWKDIKIRRIIEEEYHLPCYIENNVNVMAFAYTWLCPKEDISDFLFVSIRTGARVIPFINSRAVLSNHGFSGELGHVKIPGGSRMCSCGKIGCLNSEVSDISIVDKILEGIRVGRFREISEMVGGDLSKIDMDVFAKSVGMGHKDSLTLLRSCGETLGYALSMLVNIFAPQTLVLSGKLAKLGDPFLDPVRESIGRNSIEENFRTLKVMASSFSDNIGAIGAAALVMQKKFEFIDKPI